MDKDTLTIKNAAIGWIRCTDYLYPVDENKHYVIAFNDNGLWYYWMSGDCPYGWNVLCRNEAYWMYINEPISSK